jgi:hypothetical protein
MADLVSIAQRLPHRAGNPEQLAGMLDQLSAELAQAAMAVRDQPPMQPPPGGGSQPPPLPPSWSGNRMPARRLTE